MNRVSNSDSIGFPRTAPPSVVGLPDGVRSGGFPPVHQFECVAVGFRAVVSKGHQVSGESGDDPIDHPVARRLLAQFTRQVPDLAADCCNWQRGLLQRDALNGFLESGRNLAMLAGVCSFLSRQSGQTELPI